MKLLCYCPGRSALGSDNKNPYPNHCHILFEPWAIRSFLGETILILHASDIVSCKNGKTYRRKNGDINLQPSLRPSLEIAEGARVMLTSNKDVSDGFVNGVTETILTIVKGKMQHELPDYFCIKFDNLRMKFTDCYWVPEMTTPISFSSQKVKQKKV